MAETIPTKQLTWNKEIRLIRNKRINKHTLTHLMLIERTTKDSLSTCLASKFHKNKRSVLETLTIRLKIKFRLK